MKLDPHSVMDDADIRKLIHKESTSNAVKPFRDLAIGMMALSIAVLAIVTAIHGGLN